MKRIWGIISILGACIAIISPVNVKSDECTTIHISPPRQVNKTVVQPYDSAEQIAEEIRLGEIEMLAQLIEAEAGNQDFKGKRLVADVVLNRLDAGYGDTIEEVIMQECQFACISDGGFDRAAYRMQNDDFLAAQMEYESRERLDSDILFFTAGEYNPYCIPAYIHGAHYFGY